MAILRGTIVTGLKTLILLYKKNNGSDKYEKLRTHVIIIINELKPIAEETKSTVDDTILDILEESITE